MPSTLFPQNHRPEGFFVTGTDTNIGKTHICLGLLQGLNNQQYQTLALKPVSSGCEMTADGLRNSDALSLHKYSSFKLPYSHINPFAFAEPIAPHLAASQLQDSFSVTNIIKACQPALSSEVDYIIVEGVGGWSVPLNSTETMVELAQAFNYPIVLVVGMRLGCLNHALLTVGSILKSSQQLVGWIANIIDPGMAYLDENIRTLQDRIPAPLIGSVPFQTTLDPSITADFLDLSIVTKLRR